MFAPVRDAYRLWCLTAPQLTLDLDADSVIAQDSYSPYRIARNQPCIHQREPSLGRLSAFAPQLTLDIDADSVNPIEAGTETKSVAGTSHREPRATTRFETTTNEGGRTSYPGRAPALRQEAS